MNFERLANEPRLLLEADLAPLQGNRFQPTGFPDLGAAEYALPERREAPEPRGRGLLVESAQSMANRLESVCWDEARDDLVPELKGLPYVRSTLPDGTVTTSVLEAHRLNSPYLVNSPEFKEKIAPEIGFVENQPFDRRRLAKALLRFDPNSLVHGIFLEKVGGVVRLPRLLSGFIEAENVVVAPSGGVKIDRVQPSTTGANTPYGKADEGYGNVPFHRDEYVAGEIKAYFNLDLAQLRGYGLPAAAEALVIGLALFKIQSFLHGGLRLRTACDLNAIELHVTAPREVFPLPSLDVLRAAMPKLIASCREYFHEPAVLNVTYAKGAAKGEAGDGKPAKAGKAGKSKGKQAQAEE